MFHIILGEKNAAALTQICPCMTHKFNIFAPRSHPSSTPTTTDNDNNSAIVKGYRTTAPGIMTMLQDRYPQITTRTTRTRVAPSMLFSLSGVLMLLLTTLVVVSFSSSSSILPLVVLVSAEEEKDPFVCVPSSYQDVRICSFQDCNSMHEFIPARIIYHRELYYF